LPFRGGEKKREDPGTKRRKKSHVEILFPAKWRRRESSGGKRGSKQPRRKEVGFKKFSSITDLGKKRGES